MDDTTTQPIGADTNATSENQDTARVAYCQECGQGLTASSLRRVGAGVFCETCASVRMRGASGWQDVNATAYRGAAAVPSSGVGAVDRGPNPGLAAMLGFIPGVGAMFNGQYGKGAMHLIVFVVLVALADNLNWVLWWLVWGWIFYQVFDAYHTARALRDGLPLPNPFGWNDVGERMGFGRSSAQQPATPFATPGPRATPFTQTTTPPVTTGQQYRAAAPSANWAGYVPPQANTGSGYAPPVDDPDHNPYTAPYTAPPPGSVPPAGSVPPVAPPFQAGTFVPTYTGSASGPQLATVPSTRRFPLGALWLIGLGLLFLMGNLLPEWRLSGRWFISLILAALALWSAARRWETYRSSQQLPGTYPNLAGAMVGPVVLLTISVLLGLQAADVLGLGRSWPILLVVWGTMLLLQRSVALSMPVSLNEVPEAMAPPVRSTSGTSPLGL